MLSRLRPSDRFAWAALVLGLGGVLWRIGLTVLNVPVHNSDESVIGWAAMHIAEGRRFPVYFYGQHYMGTIEAWLAAPLVGVFGPSVWVLRVVTVGLYVLFLPLMYVLTKRVFSRGLAVVTVGLLAFGAHKTVVNQLLAGGGYPESGPMVAGLLLLTYLLAAGLVTRWYAFAGWGLLFGLIVWNHWLPAPYLLGALVMFAASRVADRRRWLITGGAAALGASPILVDWIATGVSPLHEFLSVSISNKEATLADRLDGGVWIGLPLGMGGCRPYACDWWSLWWSPVFLILVAAAIALAGRALLRRGAATGPAGTGPAPTEPARVELARQGMRLVLAAGGLGLLFSYVQNPVSHIHRWETARYLSLLLVSLPALLWPLWLLVRRASLPPAVRGLAALPIAGLTVMLLLATAYLIPRALQERAEHRDRLALIAVLERRGVTYVQAEYWTCNWITYLTDARVVCGVLASKGVPGQNRFDDYWRDEAGQAVIATRTEGLDRTMRTRTTVAPERLGRFNVYWNPPPPAAP